MEYNKKFSEEKILSITIDIEEKMLINDICKKYGISKEEVEEIASAFDLKLQKRKERSKYGVNNFPKDFARTCERYVNGELTSNDICKMYDIAPITFYRMETKWKKENSKTSIRSKKKNVTAATVTVKEPIKTTKEIYTLNKNTVIEVGLVADRHDMPIKDFIFKNMLPGQCMDFKLLKRVAESYIEKNVKFDSKGLPLNSIRCYCTGLQSALNAFIMACIKFRVNFTLMHYDSSTGKYVEQEGVVDFAMSSESTPQELCSLFRWYQKVMIHGCHPLNLANRDEFYAITIRNKDDNYRVTKSEMHIYTMYNDALTEFIKAAQVIKNQKENIQVLFNRYIKDDITFHMERPCIMESKNFYVEN